MNDISEERPDFFEGEYLGAADLQQLVVYLRDQSQRHQLGGHAWGIGAGLELVEQTSPSGSLDVYLLPGYAVDGYGRSIVVANPLLLTLDLFAAQPSGSVQVWLRYDQVGVPGLRPGFAVCSAQDAFTRVAESYSLEAGPYTTVQGQSGISVAGVAVADSRTALRVFDDNGPIACDGSVPYQDLPLANDAKSRWLIPLGLVGWQLGAPGKLLALSDDQKLLSRRLRRNLGVVAESVLAADGLIRLRRRTMALPAGQPVDEQLIDDTCATDDTAAPAHENDIQMCNGVPTFNELVWVEGRLRVTDDARILGGRLELRDSMGTSYLPPNQPGSVPLFLQRIDRKNNADLELLLGTAQTGANRFLIKQAGLPTPDPNDPCAAIHFDSATVRVAVQDNGQVGIGTDSPDELLEVVGDSDAFIHLRAKSGPNDLYAGADPTGAVVATVQTNDLRIRSGGADPTDDNFTRVAVKPTGQVGIGTTSPDPNRQVTIEHESGSYLVARTAVSSANPVPHEILVGADGNGAIVSAMTAGDDLVLRANGNMPVVWVKSSGQVGVNTPTPDRDVTIQGAASAYLSARIGQGGREVLIGADGTGTMVSAMSNDDLQLRSGGNINRVNIKASGNVGVGTDAPAERLDVRGNVKLGYNGELFAPGGLDNWRVMAGSVAAGGNLVAGSGFTSALVTAGVYEVVFTTPFSSAPIVLVTLANSGATNASPTVSFAATNLFTVAISSLGGPADIGFNFLVLGGR